MPRQRSHRFPTRCFAILLTMSLACTWVSDAFSLSIPELPSSPGGTFDELRPVKDLSQETDFVVLLVSEEIWNDDNAYLGLSEGPSFTGTYSLKGRIERYADDLQAALPWTETLIVIVSDADTPIDIQRTLENLYLGGLPGEENASQMVGVVFIGDIPIPVVNKNGYRFLSILPYTDVVNPSYILDPISQDFVLEPSVKNPQPEFWHGLIKPPLSGEEGAELLAKYFDKNHAYHEGEDEFNDFEQQILMADFLTESSTITPSSFQAYDLYLELWPVIAFGQYQNDLIEDAYLRFMNMDAGDGLDNDKDGQVDEEPENGQDDDGDGYTDEDLGDPSYLVDNDGDGAVDEDGFDDNNNDGDFFVDEDPVGDANGDGCPGLCGKDDDNDALDHDGDGFPTGWEIENGYQGEEYNVKKPYNNVRFVVQDLYGQVFETDEEAYEYLAAFYVDEAPSDSSCAAENDDDEDGFCDEDGSDDNDADLDGAIDEDPSGFQPESRIDSIPDIQAKSILEGIYKTYVQLFEGPLGSYNRFLDGSGHYDSSDYDSSMSLIAQKDAATLVILKAFNDQFESKVNEMAEELQEEIPLVAYIQIKGSITEDDESKNFCKSSKAPGTKNACIQLVNHSALPANSPFDDPLDPIESVKNLLEAPSYHFFYSGKKPWTIESVGECTLFQGTAEDGGQFVSMNLLYSHEVLDLTTSEAKQYKGCLPDNTPYLDDIEEVCFPVLATQPIFALDGGYESPFTDYQLGYPSCYEYREFEQFAVYTETNGDFSDWLTKQIKRLRKKEDLTAETYEEWLDKIEEKRTEDSPQPWEVELREDFDELYLINVELDDGDQRKYTLQDFLNDAGLGDLNENELDLYMTFHNSVTVNDPQEGSHMGNVDSIKVQFLKGYFEDEGKTQEELNNYFYYPDITTNEDEALTIPSIYYHVSPTAEVLNAQVQDQVTPNLPIDATRRVSFMDASGDAQTLTYLNVFNADSILDLMSQVKTLNEELSTIEGGEEFTDQLDKIFEDLDMQELDDALAWQNMSLDEKHEYVITHYLGSEQPYVGGPGQSAYEMVFLVADGTAQDLEFNFNASGVPDDEEIAWLSVLYEEELEESEDDVSSGTEVNDFKAVLLDEWLDEIKTWAGDIQDQVGAGYTYEAGVVCGDEPFEPLSDSINDEDGNEIPDTADLTTSLVLSTESDSVLRLGSTDYYTVSVSARTIDGGLNTEDNFTQVSLSFIDGEDVAQILGTDTLTLNNGVASFTIGASELGSFSVSAAPTNRENLGETNSLSGSVSDQYLKITVLEKTTEGEDMLGETSGQDTVYVNEFTVEKGTELVVQAQLRNIDGEVLVDENDSLVQFSLSDSNYGTLSEEVVAIKNGQAVTIFNPGTSSGTLSISAEFVDEVFPVDPAEFTLTPGDASQVQILSESAVLPVGAVASTPVQVKLLDDFGNTASVGFYTVTIQSNGNATLYGIVDEDRDTEGTQVTTATGLIDFYVLAGTNEGVAEIYAQMNGNPESIDTLEIEILDGMKIEIITRSSFLTAGSESTVVVEFELVDASGEVVRNFQGDLSLSVSDPLYGSFDRDTLSLVNGKGSANFQAGTLTGLASLLAESDGLELASETLEIKPGDPYQLKIQESKGMNILSAGDASQFEVQVLDQWGNLVIDDSETILTLTATQASEPFVDLPEASLTVNQGTADFTLTPGALSGPVGLSASSEGLFSATWEGEIRYVMETEDLKNIETQALFMGFWGGPFGDLTQENYLAGWMLFNGKTQGIYSSLNPTELHASMVSIDSNGKINVSEGSFVDQSVLKAGSDLPVRIQWRNFVDGTLLGEVIYVTMPTGDAFDVSLLSSDPNYQVQEGESLLSPVEIYKGPQLIAKIGRKGQIEIYDSNYQLNLNAESDGLSFIISDSNEPIVEIDLNLPKTKEVSLVPADFDLEDWDTLLPGIYIRPSSDTLSQYESILTGNSSHNASGLALVDPDELLASSQAPSNFEEEISGWEDENKIFQLMASGNTAGDASLSHVNESAIFLGDPSLTLPNSDEPNEAGFTETMGQRIFAGSEDIQSLLTLDVNGDDREDLLLVYPDRLELLQNQENQGWLRGFGTFLSVENGIADIGSGDWDDDGWEDLVLVTEDPCYDGEQCLYLFRNQEGAFSSESLEVENIDAKIEQVAVADLNQDDFADLLLVDENMVLYLVWNQEGVISSAEELGDFGLVSSEGENLSGDLYLHWATLEEGSASLPITDTSDTVSEEEFVSGDSASAQASMKVQKLVTDVDGGTAKVGDKLDVQVTLTNIGSEDLNELYLSDLIASNFVMDEDSFECIDCDASTLSSTDSFSHPWVYGPINLGVGEEITLTYDVTLMNLPQLTLSLAQDLSTEAPDDDFLDIGVSVDANQTGMLIIFASEALEEGEDGFETVSYSRSVYSPTLEDTGEVSDPFEDTSDSSSIFEDMDAEKGFPVPSDGSFDVFHEIMGAEDLDGDGYYSTEELYQSSDDSDGDGLNDLVDPWNVDEADVLLEADLDGTDVDLEVQLEVLNESLDDVTSTVEDVVSTYTCNGGCLAIPSSISFLTPGFFHNPLTGEQLGWDSGWPMFGLIITPIPMACSGPTCSVPNSPMRFYLSPTTTLGLAASICILPYPGGQCFSYNIPILDIVGICDTLNDYLSEAMSKASSFATDLELSSEASAGDTKLLNVNSEASIGSNQSLESEVFTGYSPPDVVDTNIQVPGFPEVFTEWWKLQKMEFFKLLDLPDLYFIYPDPDSLLTNADINPVSLQTDVMGLESFLNLANSLPLVTINPEKVYFRFPWVSQAELDFMKKEIEQWLDHAYAEYEVLQAEWESIKASSPDLEPVFEKLEGVYLQAVGIMENNLAVLESYSKIPYEIMEIREAQSYYAQVVVCYLDAVLQYFGGYYLENLSRVVAWVQWVAELKDLVKGWQAIIQSSMKLMDSCDKCTNQRYSTFSMLANLFVFVPDIPVIEFPKWPDIVLDVSAIQGGVEIIWPDIVFVPEPISLPSFPSLDLPSLSIAADFNIELPVLPEFDFNLELPELPALELPNLPDLPPPPTIPEFDPTLEASLDIVSGIIRLICTIRQGFIPTPENLLKTQIEDLTQRPANVLLPADLAFTVDYGNFHYTLYKRIELITTVNLTIELDPLFAIFEFAADQSNEFISDLSGEASQKIDFVLDQVDAVIEEVDSVTDLDIDVDTEVEADFTDVVDQVPSPISTDLASAYPNLDHQIDILNAELIELQNQINEWDESNPDQIVLKAELTELSLDDPLFSDEHFAELIESQNLSPELMAIVQDTPMETITDLRADLLNQTIALEDGNEVLADLEAPGDFFNALALENKNQISDYAFASEEVPISSSIDWNPELLAVEPKDVPLTLAEDEDEIAISSLSASDNGLYLIDESLGLNTKLIAYSAESDELVNFAFLDVDQDGDRDIVYSLGGDVYLKENFEKAPDLDYSGQSPEVMSLSELNPNEDLVDAITVTGNGQETASFTFTPSADAEAYEALLYDSLDAAYGSPKENLSRILLFNISSLEKTPLAGAESMGIQYYSPIASIENSSGSVKLFNAKERILMSENAQIESSDALNLQTLSPVKLEITLGTTVTSLEIQAGQVLQLPVQTGRTIRLEEGEMIWIKDELIPEQDVVDGMALLEGEVLILDSFLATATLNTSLGQKILLDREEEFWIQDLNDADYPAIDLNLENGAYYVRVRPMSEDNELSYSVAGLVHPQICADDSAPFASLDGDLVDLALYTKTTVSAANSFDTDSDVLTATWDLDPNVDADSDGNPSNDEDLSGLEIEIGPYEYLEDQTLTVSVKDLVGNTSEATVEIHLYIPELQLSSASPQSVLGSSDPETPQFPFQLIRLRDGIPSEIGDGYLTNDSGEIDIGDLNDSDLMAVYDEDGTLIAEFNPITKQLLSLNEDYEVVAYPAIEDWPSHLSVVRSSDEEVMASVILVADETQEAQVIEEALNDNILSEASGLVYTLPASSANFSVNEDGLALYDSTGNLDLLLTPTANLLFKDDRFEVLKEEASTLDEYLILNVYQDGELILQFHPGNASQGILSSEAELGLSEAPDSSEIPGVTSEAAIFEDLDPSDPLYDPIMELVERGILEGYDIDGMRYFLPDQLISRAEFTKIVLGILCIVPSEEAKAPPDVFFDIDDPELWYYSYTKESYLQNMITGYLAEINSNGLSPFKPNNNITRAESAKIVLEALNTEEIISLPEVDLAPGEPWFAPYLEISQNLSEILNTDSAGEEHYILTAEEARDPSHWITRYEFVQISVRALQAYDCYEEDLSNESIDLDTGSYLLAGSCNQCPCLSSVDFEGDIRPGDLVFVTIQDGAGLILDDSNRIQIAE